MKEQTYVSVVAYAHNDADIVKDFILRVDRFLDHHFAVYEIILVDDCSTDTTLERAFELKDRVKGNVTLIALKEQLGSHRTLTAGTDLSIGDFIFEFDSLNVDFPLELLLKMFQQSTTQGCDVVFAVPESLHRDLGSAVVKRLARGRVTRMDSSLRLVTRRALYAMTRQAVYGADRNVLYQACGFDWMEMRYTPDRQSASCRSRSGRSTVDLLLLFTDTAGRLPFWLSALFLIGAIVTVVVGDGAPAYLGALISAGFGLLFLMIGLVYRHLRLLLRDKTPNPYQVREVKRINRY